MKKNKTMNISFLFKVFFSVGLFNKNKTKIMLEINNGKLPFFKGFLSKRKSQMFLKYHLDSKFVVAQRFSKKT